MMGLINSTIKGQRRFNLILRTTDVEKELSIATGPSQKYC